MNARGFCGFEEFNHEVDLRKRFAAAHGNAAVASPVGLIADCLLQQILCGNFERSVLGPVCAFCPEVPSFRIVAELAAHGAALRKDDESNSWPIDRAERFKLIDSSESHEPKIKKSCSIGKSVAFVLYNTKWRKMCCI